MIVNLKIENCGQCPYKVTVRHYTADPFETEFDWRCKKNNNAVIVTLDWNDKTRPDIPKWCPLIEN